MEIFVPEGKSQEKEIKPHKQEFHSLYYAAVRTERGGRLGRLV